MYRACHVIYTIITISTAWYLINFFQCPIPLAVHTEAPLQTNSSNMAYEYHYSNKRDQITSIFDVTIVYVILLC